jgi:hypothetical protein
MPQLLTFQQIVDSLAGLDEDELRELIDAIDEELREKDLDGFEEEDDDEDEDEIEVGL